MTAKKTLLDEVLDVVRGSGACVKHCRLNILFF